MKSILKHFLSVFIALLIGAGCEQSESPGQPSNESARSSTERLAQQDYVGYPMGQPLDSEIEYYKWKTVHKSQQETARQKSNQLVK